MSPDPRSRGAEILIVDDSPVNLDLLSRILTTHGFRVRTVTSGSLALRSVAAARPDIILLDIMMPGLDGYAVARQIKANPDTSSIPIVFVSARNQVSAKLEAFASGGVDYIAKPFSAEELLARVRNHLELASLRRELARKNEQLQDLMRQRGSLTGMVVHDLNNLLSVMTLSAAMLNAAPELTDDAAEDVANLGTAVGSVRRLIETLMDVARLDSGAWPTYLQPVNVRRVVQEQLAAWRAEPGHPSHSLKLTAARDLPRACADRSLVEHVVSHLMADFPRCRPGAPCPTMCLLEEDGSLILRLQSETTPLKPGTQDELFERLARLAPRGQVGSSGMGLAFCRKAAEQMGGRLVLSSTVDAGVTGVTLDFVLPVWREGEGGPGTT